MNKLRSLLTAGVVMSLAASAFGEPESKCFKNAGLKDQDFLRFQVDGAKVSGTYTIEREYNSEAPESYEFSGSQSSGRTITVKLAGKGPVNARPLGLARMEMNVVQSGDDEILRVKFYNGKQKLIDTYEFESCEPSYAKLAKAATRLSVGEADGSVERTVKFETRDDRIAFWLKVAKGKSFNITAPGVGISFYYPDKKRYEEGAAIDVLSMEKLPQGGDYLVVLSPAPEPSERSVTFTVAD